MAVTITREAVVRIARNVVTGPNRPGYCKNPAAFDPDEWVIEAMERAYLCGRIEGVAEAAAVITDAERPAAKLAREMRDGTARFVGSDDQLNARVEAAAARSEDP